MPVDSYYTEEGRVKRLINYHYLVVKGTTRENLTFAATDVETADKKAVRWAKKRGYKIYRKKNKHHV